MNTPTKSHIETSRLLVGAASLYAVRLAQSADDVRAAQVLRFEVFNVELNEGLAESFATGQDVDPFDAVCDHMIVQDRATGNVVGTYRLQTGCMAAANRGYYSEQEFCFSPYERIRGQLIELAARACIARTAIWLCSACCGKASPITRANARGVTCVVAAPSRRWTRRSGPRPTANCAANISPDQNSARARSRSMNARWRIWPRKLRKFPSCCAPTFRSAQKSAAHRRWTANSRRLIS